MIQYSGRPVTEDQIAYKGIVQPTSDGPLPASVFANTYKSNILSAMHKVGTPNPFDANPPTETVPAPSVPGHDDSKNSTSFQTFNIITDYDWTYSENKKIYEELAQEGIPRIELMEMRIKASTMVSKIRSLLSSAADVSSAVTGSAKDIVSAVTSALGIGGGDTINAGIDVVKSNIQPFFDAITKFAGTDKGYIPNSYSESPHLAPYSQLYITERTNIKYVLPYFSNEFLSVENQFSEYESKTGLDNDKDSSLNVIKKLTKAGLDLAEGIAGNMLSVAQVAQPGVYIERPKFYNFETDAPTITFSFPLLNTLHDGAYYKNLEFINRFVLMNKPHRINKVLVDPPAIYSVNQPGVAYYPYVYIRSMSVEHVGTKRLLGSNLVPDAFLIKITLQPLTSNANNYMLMNEYSPLIGSSIDSVGPIQLYVKQTSGPAATTPPPNRPAINPKQDYGGGGTNTQTDDEKIRAAKAAERTRIQNLDPVQKARELRQLQRRSGIR